MVALIARVAAELIPRNARGSQSLRYSALGPSITGLAAGVLTSCRSHRRMLRAMDCRGGQLLVGHVYRAPVLKKHTDRTARVRPA
jgi:hypothetical protein